MSSTGAVAGAAAAEPGVNRRTFLTKALSGAALAAACGCGAPRQRAAPHRPLTAAQLIRQRDLDREWQQWVWRPRGPLPPPAIPGRPLHVVFTPHPDDETLTMGVYIANATARGERVIVVALTDGKRTGVGGYLNRRLDHEQSLLRQLLGKHAQHLGREGIGAARVRELRAAVARLGVAPADLFLAHLDDENTPDFGRITDDEAHQVVTFFARRYPHATFVTMSYLADELSDHLCAGRALYRALGSGLVGDAQFAVSRLWWRMPSPPHLELRPDGPAVTAAVRSAAVAYDHWDPGHGWYAVGWQSVIHQFKEFVADPVCHLHPPGPVAPGPAPTTDPSAAQPANPA